MTRLPLPALDGRKPLAFLAALGLARLLTVHAEEPARLSWEPRDGTAVLETRQDTVEAVVGRLLDIARSIPPGAALPGVPRDLPPPGAAPDKLRLRPADLRSLATQLVPEPNLEAEAWLTSLVTDLSVDDNGRSNISLMAAPSGRQSMRTMLEKSLSLIDETTLREALLGWRRYPGVTGEYLDHQVLFDAADSGTGESNERGVPGATWLALMSYPLLRTTAIGSERITTGWHRTQQRRPMLIYPLWSAALDVQAVVALLGHPLWSGSVDGTLPREASVFTVFSVHRARRRRLPGRTFDGVLTPVP